MRLVILKSAPLSPENKLYRIGWTYEVDGRTAEARFLLDGGFAYDEESGPPSEPEPFTHPLEQHTAALTEAHKRTLAERKQRKEEEAVKALELIAAQRSAEGLN